jgi:RNA polymerase sigma factor (sigma-70 family)
MSATTRADVILRHLRTFAAADSAGGPSDRQLLEQFVAGRETAFEALVRRHAPLVLAVCRRVLRNEADADDAFQATFLVLAKKASEVGRQGSVAGWLHRVAYHAAIKVRGQAANRERHERQALPRRPADPLAEVTGREFLAVLDEELQRLPDDARAALVLCYLQGHTCDDAARQLGCSVRTLKRRLEKGRNGLKARLARRGIALPAALLALGVTQAAKAAVPEALAAATVKAARDAAAGTCAASAAGAAAEALLRGAGAGRFKVLAALLALGALVVGTALVAHQAQAQRPPADAPAAPGAEPQPNKAAAPPAKEADDAKKDAITGRVLDADGKPVKGAAVGGYAVLDLGNLSPQAQFKRLADVKTDEEGRFRLPLTPAPGERIGHVELLAGAKGYGPGWSRRQLGGNEIELRLPPEAAVVGRLIDLQGETAAKVKLRVVRVLPDKPRVATLPGGDDENSKQLRERMREMMRLQEAFEFRLDSPLKDFPLWPAAVTADGEGRFRLTGFGKGQEVHLVVEDDRFARQEIVVKVGAGEERFGLLPPRKVSGRVVAADTDKPVADAWVVVTSYRDRRGAAAQVRTDAEGRFAVTAYPGESYDVTAYPPAGEPYLGTSRSGDWPRGAERQEVNLKLPRGAVVRGKVVEGDTGKPVRSAAVDFLPQRENNPDLPRGALSPQQQRAFTDADGTFRAVFPPGRGHLTVTGPDADYVFQTVSEDELLSGKVGGRAQRFHSVAAMELKAKGEPKEVKIELRRAVTIKGKVVGPDGKPVKDAVVFVPSELRPYQTSGPLVVLPSDLPPGAQVTAVAAVDGAFELPNCDPEKTYRVFVLSGRVGGGAGQPAVVGPRGRPATGSRVVDAIAVVNQLIAAKDSLGAVADLSAKAAGGKPVEVKLAACESAEVRCVDGKGKAAPQKVWLELVVKPGPSLAKSRELGKPAGEASLLAVPYSLRGEKSPVAADGEGRVTIPGLIPGATYRVKVLAGPPMQENEVVVEKDFTVEAGKKTKLELVAPQGK